MSDIVSKVFSIIMNMAFNPKRLFFIVLILLFFPLNLLDYFFSIIVNFLVGVFNLILWILGLIINFIIWAVNEAFDKIWHLLNTFSVEIGDPPVLSKFDFKTQEYVSVDIFGVSACLFTIILDWMNINFPIW